MVINNYGKNCNNNSPLYSQTQTTVTKKLNVSKNCHDNIEEGLVKALSRPTTYRTWQEIEGI